MPITRARTSARLLAAVCLAPLLVGCTGNASLSQDATFDGAAASASNAGEGLILVGVRVLREPKRHNWLIGATDITPVYRLTVSSLTPDGKLGRVSRSMRICEETRSLPFGGVLGGCNPHALQYRLVSVPPGQYTLNSFSYHAYKLNVSSSFVAPPTTRRVVPMPVPYQGDPVRNPAQSFGVQPGEIVYIGDLTFDFDPRGVGARMTVSHNDAAARRALAAYPSVHGNVVFRPVAGEGSGSLDAADGPVPNVLTQ